MSYMFYGCKKLKSIELGVFNTSSLIDITYMFSYCSSLVSLNLYNFNISLIHNILRNLLMEVIITQFIVLMKLLIKN